MSTVCVPRKISSVILTLLAGLVLFVSGCGSSATTESTRAGKEPNRAYWGQKVDPDRDCTFGREGEALTISVPATPHDLSAELGKVNAPRVLQEVTDDFSAQVKVSGIIHPTTPGSVPGRLAYQAGGLLLWSDPQNYIRLERAGMGNPGPFQAVVAFEARVNGQVAGAQSRQIPSADTWLRLERRGLQINASFSLEGKQWLSLSPMNIALPARVSIGVAAINAAQEPLGLRYEEFRVSR
jgi:regulation of enolase protein 1 (concanavalin A-like superfamily)